MSWRTLFNRRPPLRVPNETRVSGIAQATSLQIDKLNHHLVMIIMNIYSSQSKCATAKFVRAKAKIYECFETSDTLQLRI